MVWFGRFLKKMERIPCKDMKDKLFRVSTEVRSVLQRQHDHWSPLRAFERVKKDLDILHVLCKVFLAFFKKESDDERAAVCNGKSVKMFADMIRKSLQDEDFVLGMIFKRLFYVSFFYGVVYIFLIFSWVTILQLYIPFCHVCRLCFGIRGDINRRYC